MEPVIFYWLNCQATGGPSVCVSWPSCPLSYWQPVTQYCLLSAGQTLLTSLEHNTSSTVQIILLIRHLSSVICHLSSDVTSLLTPSLCLAESGVPCVPRLTPSSCHETCRVTSPAIITNITNTPYLTTYLPLLTHTLHHHWTECQYYF